MKDNTMHSYFLYTFATLLIFFGIICLTDTYTNPQVHTDTHVEETDADYSH